MRAFSIALMAVSGLLVQPSFAQDATAPAVEAPRNCVMLNRIRQTRVIDDQTIVFQMNGSKLYKNVLPNRCPQLGFERSFSYATSITQLCNVDIITVLTQFGGQLQRGASCGLGKFEPITKEEFAALKKADKKKSADDETSR